MASGSFEHRDFDVGGVPAYAQEVVDAGDDAAAEFTAYGHDPDSLPGADDQAAADDLQETHAADQTWPEFGELVEDEPDTHRTLGASGDRTGDEDLLDENVIPEQPGPGAAETDAASADAADAVSEDAELPGQPETTDRRFEDETATPEEAAAIIAAEFGLDIEEARRLVAKATADLDAASHDQQNDAGEADTREVPDEEAGDAPDDKADTEEGPSATDKVVKFLRRATSATGDAARHEASIFAEGARLFGEEFRAWYAAGPERRVERALAKAAKRVQDDVRKHDKFERHRGRMTGEAPRGDDDR